MKIHAIQSRVGAESKNHSRQCVKQVHRQGKKLECGVTTREGKPYCPEHVEDHSYVQGILALLAEQDKEKKAAQKGWKAIDIGGLTSREILLILGLQGGRTIERLSRETQIEISILETYVEALQNEGKIVLGRTNRGSTVVKLAPSVEPVEPLLEFEPMKLSCAESHRNPKKLGA